MAFGRPRSIAASISFALAPGNTNPQGIADPPLSNLLVTGEAGSSVEARYIKQVARFIDEQVISTVQRDITPVTQQFHSLHAAEESTDRQPGVTIHKKAAVARRRSGDLHDESLLSLLAAQSGMQAPAW